MKINSSKTKESFEPNE